MNLSDGADPFVDDPLPDARSIFKRNFTIREVEKKKQKSETAMLWLEIVEIEYPELQLWSRTYH